MYTFDLRHSVIESCLFECRCRGRTWTTTCASRVSSTCPAGVKSTVSQSQSSCRCHRQATRQPPRTPVWRARSMKSANLCLPVKI